MEYDVLTDEVLRTIVSLCRVADRKQVSRMSQGEMFVLHFLLERDGPCLPGEISAAMGTSSARTAAALNSLERKGDIFRIPDETDRRRVQVRLTDAGRDRLLEGRRSMQRDMRAILIELGADDAAELLRLLRRLNVIAQSHHPET